MHVIINTNGRSDKKQSFYIKKGEAKKGTEEPDRLRHTHSKIIDHFLIPNSLFSDSMLISTIKHNTYIMLCVEVPYLYTNKSTCKKGGMILPYAYPYILDEDSS